MTTQDLLRKCDESESQGGRGGFAVKIFRRTRADRMKVAPGIFGKVLDNTSADYTVVWLESAKVRKAIAGYASTAAEQGAATDSQQPHSVQQGKGLSAAGCG